MKAMRLYQDITRGQYMVTREAQPKLRDRRTRTQKVDAETGLSMWSTELTALLPPPDGAAVFECTTLGESAPELSVGEYVSPIGLEAMPWSTKDKETGETRTGVAFRAKELRPLSPAK